MTTPVPGKAIACTFFKLISPETYKCNLCDHDYKSKGTGHTNLKTHIQSKHPDAYNDFKQALQSGSTLDMSKYRYPKKTLRIHAWVEYVVMTLAPFRKIMCKYTRKNFKHEPIHLNTFYAYLDKLTKHVEEKIAKLLPDKFALVFDGWESSGTHYVGLFATFPSEKKSSDVNYERVLLSFSPLLNEDRLGAEEHVEFIEYHLGIFKKTKDHIVSMSGDNCNVNKSIANMLEKQLVGCASHRFNLAVQDMLTEYQPLIRCINKLMVKLSKVRAMAKLRNFTDLGPIRNNSTRRSSTYSMLKRFCDIKKYLPKLNIDAIDDLTPGRTDCRKIEKFCKTMKDLESVTKDLQDEKVTLSDVKHLFEDVVNAYPSTNDRPGPDANIIHCPNFESAVAKIQDKLVSSLTDAEKHLVQSLCRSEPTETHECEKGNNLSLAERSKKRRRLSKSSGDLKYIDLSFILPTSNICERLFSMAGLALTDCRQSISPVRLEAQVFLYINSHLWGISDVHEVIRKNPLIVDEV